MVTLILTDEQYKEFLEMLEGPAIDLPELRKLLAEPSVFDEGRKK